MIAKDEDGNWFAVISIGVAVPCRTRAEAVKVSEQIMNGMYIGAAIATVVVIAASLILTFLLRG